MERSISTMIGESLELHGKLAEAVPSIAMAAGIMIEALKGGGKVMVAGNGGSAADAQHMAAELVNRFRLERAPIACVALTTDTSVMTSIANDRSFDEVFERQVLALGKRGDVLVVITTSGSSINVLKAIEAASSMGVSTVALTGKDGIHGGRVDCEIRIPSTVTPRIQEAHLLVEHILCDLVEQALYARI